MNSCPSIYTEYLSLYKLVRSYLVNLLFQEDSLPTKAKMPKNSIPIIDSNIKIPTRVEKKSKNIYQIICFSYNKKGHYLKNCIKIKAKN